MIGGDRSFKLALKEKGEEFSNELREDCEMRGMERSGGEREGRGGVGERAIPISEVVSAPYTNSVCVLEWKCPVSRGKGVFLLPPCVCPPLTATGDPPSCPLHAGPS